MQVNYLPSMLATDLFGEWFSGEAVLALEDSEMEMNGSWLKKAFADDQHVAVRFEDKKLASYFWFSEKPVHTSANYTASVSPDYLYGYKAYTCPDMRGRGLLLDLIKVASHQAYLLGKKGIITHVEVDNLASKRVHARAKALVVGFHILFNIGYLKFTFNSPGCGRYGSCLLRRS
ncbi:MAG: hypothetical protein IPK77_11430 [Cellvibrio sp.]|nr:hypothetical protein [Cellvibrio sp.]